MQKLNFNTLDEAIKELSKDNKNVSMMHVMYNGTGLCDVSIRLNDTYPKNHNVGFKEIMINNDETELYTLTYNKN